MFIASPLDIISGIYQSSNKHQYAASRRDAKLGSKTNTQHFSFRISERCDQQRNGRISPRCENRA